ncbi:hypothetical protein FQN53_009212 [Emmonsiellopsis sp. PD_33]|nr:hypothetical protein FQN53_009212 [Emmonsiellopsis sp. PD_33]
MKLLRSAFVWGCTCIVQGYAQGGHDGLLEIGLTVGGNAGGVTTVTKIITQPPQGTQAPGAPGGTVTTTVWASRRPALIDIDAAIILGWCHEHHYPTASPPVTVTVTDTVTESFTETDTITIPNTITVPNTITITDEDTLTVPVTITDENTITVPITEVVTLPASTTTTVITLPGATETVTTTLPASTITLSGSTVTIPASTIVTTTTAPGEIITTTVTLPGSTATVTRTGDGTTGTITNTVTNSITLCPTRTLNPTFTPVAPVPDNYLWGCPPGKLCIPNRNEADGDCNFEVGRPADTFYCSPQECHDSPPLREFEYWGPVDSDEVGKFTVSPHYFNLDPRAFGLDYSIFQFANSTDYEESHNSSSYRIGLDLQGRQVPGDDHLPSGCYEDCNAPNLEHSYIGKDPEILCATDSVFLATLARCEDCVAIKAGVDDPKPVISVQIPDFVNILDFCEVSSPPDETTAPPVQTSTEGPPEETTTEPPPETTTTEPPPEETSNSAPNDPTESVSPTATGGEGTGPPTQTTDGPGGSPTETGGPGESDSSSPTSTNGGNPPDQTRTSRPTRTTGGPGATGSTDIPIPSQTPPINFPGAANIISPSSSKFLPTAWAAVALVLALI